MEVLSHREHVGKDHRPPTHRRGGREKLRAVMGVSGCQPGVSRWSRPEKWRVKELLDGIRSSRQVGQAGAGAPEEPLRHLCSKKASF